MIKYQVVRSRKIMSTKPVMEATVQQLSAKHSPFSITVLVRAVLLNGIYGTVFGYLYWKRGLESSMISHLTADLLVHVILPAIL
jgi:hypothetical protein